MKLLIKDLVLGSGAPDELQSSALSDYYDTLTSGIGFDLVENGPINSCGIGYTDAEEVDVELLLKDCVASWNCNEGSGVTLGDNSGDGHDGTLTNFGPVAEYHFDGDCTDETGSYDGTPTDITYDTGVVGQAASFNGTSSGINLGNITGLIDSYTIAGWFKANDATPASAVQLVVQNAAFILGWETDGSIMHWHHDGSGWSSPAQSDTTLSDDTWYHLAATYDGTTLKLYVDSVLQADTETDTPRATESGNNVYISDSTYLFDGFSDDVRVYPYALSQAEIDALYNRPQLPSHWVDGISGKALSFDGVDDEVTVTKPSGWMDAWTDSFTISCWLKIPSSYTWDIDSNLGIVSCGQFSGSFGIVRYSAINRIAIYVRGDAEILVKASVIARDTWYHVVGTWDGTDTVSLYVDGALIGTETGTPTGSPDASSNDIYFGGNRALGGSSPYSFYEGLLDEVRIFDRALTAAEVKFLYNNPGSMDTVAVADSPDANGLYLLDTTFDNDALEFGRAIISHDGSYIGRIALGFARSLGVAPTREAGFYTTESPRVTAAGQIIPGAGGMHGRRIAVDFRYKIDPDIFDDIEDAIEYISKGYPWFMAFTTKEQNRLPWPRLYASPENPEILLQSSVNRFLYSKQFDFYERF